MKITRYLKGKITIQYIKQISWQWPHFARYWSGRILHFSVGKITLVLDCSGNFIKDMKTGKPE
jgi:hypothetical protein